MRAAVEKERNLFPPIEEEASGSSARKPLLLLASSAAPSGVHALLSEMFMPHTKLDLAVVDLSTPTPFPGSHGPHVSVEGRISLLVEDDKRRSNSNSAHLNIFAFATTDDRIAHRTGQPPCNVRADFRLTAPPIPALRTASEINGYRNGGLHIPTRQDPCPPRQEPKEACSNVAFPSLRGQTSAAQACGVHGGVALQSSGPRLEVVVSKQPSGIYQLDGGVAAVIVAGPNRP